MHRNQVLRTVGLTLVTLGLLSLLVAMAWPWLVNSTELMTQQEAQEYTQATMDHHRLAHAFAQQRDETPSASPTQAMQAAATKFEVMYQRQAQLRHWRDKGGLKYRWSGIALVLLGVAILGTSQMRSNS